ncbi:hypothetical protein [Saccharolobus islandicus]|uniref:Uncharacterized protein n=1 Tax=Saccharolobus islandicus (strain M.16.4 / Kamchatka \|nr:hypothetical protein [Sulfolobus islandicus]ACR41156.1 hypothetical protein M164_0525 [Sulfolobus islandicus M.16.4]
MKKLFAVVGSFFSGLGIWFKSIDKATPAIKIIVDNGTLVKIFPIQSVATQSVDGIANISPPIPFSSSLTSYYTEIPPPWYANLWPEVLAVGIVMLGIAIFGWVRPKFRR